jgi:hypothetical protein
MVAATRASQRIALEVLMVDGITAAIVFVLATGAIAAPTSSFWARALDSRPEAIATGAALLVLASVLRRSLPNSRTR